jgi:hypothetical protein
MCYCLSDSLKMPRWYMENGPREYRCGAWLSRQRGQRRRERKYDLKKLAKKHYKNVIRKSMHNGAGTIQIIQLHDPIESMLSLIELTNPYWFSG